MNVWAVNLWEVVKESAAIAGALVTLGAGIWWLVKPRAVEWFRREVLQPVQETHHSVTVNGHQSDEPTLRDQVDSLQDTAQVLIRRAETNAGNIDAIRAELTDHGDKSRAAMAIYRSALADQGIHLPVVPGEDGYGLQEGRHRHD